ncbi:MAG: hypothetical protein ACYCOU_00230 [Sulfobacillus sp.]
MSDDSHLRASIDGLLAAAKCVARENLNVIARLERELAAVEQKAAAEWVAIEAIEKRMRSLKGAAK